MATGKFEFYSGDTKWKGDFNIYQSRSGAIVMVMGSKPIVLEIKQIESLPITIYELDNFDIDEFENFYSDKNCNHNADNILYSGSSKRMICTDCGDEKDI